MNESPVKTNEVPVNMIIYDAVRSVPKEAQRPYNNGSFSGIDINPMWRIKKLTELFGPAGIGWYTDIVSERNEHLADDTIIAVVELNLYVKYNGEWSQPIFGTGGNILKTKTSKGYVKTSDEGYKMAYTDALGVACKALGIGADIYFSSDTSTKYAQYYDAGAQPQRDEDEAPPKPTPKPAPTAKPETVTAVVELTEDPAEVPQETLTLLVQTILASKGKSMEIKKEIASMIKPIAGNANYKDFPDPTVRKNVYDALYNKYMKDARKGEKNA